MLCGCEDGGDDLAGCSEDVRMVGDDLAGRSEDGRTMETTLEDTVRMVRMASKDTVVAPQTQQCRRVEFCSQLCVLKDHRAEA